MSNLSSNRNIVLASLPSQLTALLAGERDFIANLSNTAGLLKQLCDYWWVGFYLVKDDELVLGPFQGPVACTRIGYGKGVCGTSWAGNKTMVVPDVHEFPGHIACNAESASEVVVPILKDGEVSMVMDIDSRVKDDFSSEEVAVLEEVARILQDHLYA